MSCVQKNEKNFSKNEESLRESEKPTKAKVNELFDFDYSKFIDDGYIVLDTARGDLNKDDFLDFILILKKVDEELTHDLIEHPEPRPLLIFCGDANGNLRLEYRNDAAVLGVGCGGMMGDPYAGITIKDGYFTVEHFGGSSWKWTRLVTFKYVERADDWYLHRDGGDYYHSSDPKNTKETTIRTIKDFGEISFENFDIYAQTEIQGFTPSEDDLHLKFSEFELLIDSLDYWDEEDELKELQSDRANIYLELGESIVGKSIKITSLKNKDIRVYQCYENSITVMREGPHCDLLNWKHYTSDWVELTIKGESFITNTYSEKEWNKFDEVDISEFIEAVKEHCGDDWANHVKDIKSVKEYPSAVGVSKILLKIEILNEDESISNKIIAFEIPMGC